MVPMRARLQRGAGAEGGAHAVESGALDLERLAGRRFDGDLEGGGDSEVD